MEALTIMNSKEKKKVFKAITDQWDANLETIKELVFLSTTKGKIFIATQEAVKLEQSIKSRKYSIGNYFGTYDEKVGFRASIEGSQILGPSAQKNVVQIDDALFKLWMLGHDLEMPIRDDASFVIVKHNEDFIGCGKYSGITLLNYIPKTRRLVYREY